MVTNIMALRLKGCRVKPSMMLIPSFYKVSISYIRGSRKISILMPGCLGPSIRMDSKRYFLFSHNHVGRLYIVNITGHMLWVLVLSPNEFIPSCSTQTEYFLGLFQIPGSTSHRITSTCEHQLYVKAFHRPSCDYLNPTIASVQHPSGSRRNTSSDPK
jgi:hypothetical protein